MSLRGNTAPPDGCPRGRSTVPAGCAAGSRMMNPRSGIGERPWMPPSSCWKSCNFSHEKTLPGRDWQTLAAPGQEAFLTPYLTTVRTGTPGNSGFKSAKKYLIPSVKRRKALQITIKNLVQAFGCRRPGVRVPALRPNFAEKPPKQAVFLRLSLIFVVLEIAVLRRFQWWNSGRGMSERSRRNRQIPNPSLTGELPHFLRFYRCRCRPLLIVCLRCVGREAGFLLL